MHLRLPILLGVLTASFASIEAADACTAFLAQTADGPILAKSFDWSTGEGWLVVNERGRQRSLLAPSGAPSDTWVSRYASLTVTTVGPGFPVSGMNEEGLTIEALVDFSVRPTLAPARGHLTGLEFIQYGLDHFRTVEELKPFALSASITQVGVPLHFFACDRTGSCAVIETQDGKTAVTSGALLEARALANAPYVRDLEVLHPSLAARLLGLGSPAPQSSAARFKIAAQSTPRDENEALMALEKVANPQMTRWQIVWNLGHGSLQLKQHATKRETLTEQLLPLAGPCQQAPLVRPLSQTRGEFRRWTPADSALAEAAIRAQLGPGSEQASTVAQRVAEATGSSTCAASE